jgi:hypothetical protein
LKSEVGEKQNIIEYMNAILNTMKGPNDFIVEKAIDLEVARFEA